MLRIPLVATMTLVLLASSPGQEATSGQDLPVGPGQTETYQLEIYEKFSTTGDEPSQWASFSRSDAARREVTAGLFEFTFQLREIEAKLGSAQTVRFLPTSGVSRLRITQDAPTQQLDLPKAGLLSGFLNSCLEDLQPLGSTFVTSARLFDGSVVPGADETATELSCRSEVIASGDLVYTLLEFVSQPVSYTARGSEIESLFRGAAMIDRSRGEVLHMAFQQTGSVRTGNLRSNFDQLTRTELVNSLGQPKLPITEAMAERLKVFFYSPSLELDDLDPDILDDNPRPAWAVPTWLAGRMAEASLGLVAEQGTNPIPVTSLGGLILTDQSLGFAGNILFDNTLVELGQRDGSETDPADWEIRSPLERALGSLNADPSEPDTQPVLFGPETQGSAQVGEEIIPLGISFSAARELMDNAGPSNLNSLSTGGPAFSATGGSTALAAAGSVWPALLAVVGTAAVVTVIEDGDEDENDANSPATLIYNELTNGAGCNEGSITLRVEGDEPGVVWRMVGDGIATVECTVGSGTAWSETGMDVTNGAGVAEFSIPVRPFRDCLDATLTVTRDGQSASFNYSWPEEGVSGFAVGSISNDCL